MNLLADENIDDSVLVALRNAGHDVQAVSEMEPGIHDEAVLSRANSNESILLTEDKDFGELVFRLKLVHSGVILARLAGLPAAAKAALLVQVVATHEPELLHSFTVVSPGSVRIRRPPLPQ